MEWPTYISSALIILGAALMLVNIVSHQRTIHIAREFERKKSSLTNFLVIVHLVFMAFFFLGYLAVLYFSLYRVEFASSLFVAIIFFFGAVFVFLGIVIQKRMFLSLESHNIELQEHNDLLKQEHADLIEINDQLKSEVADRIKGQQRGE